MAFPNRRIVLNAQDRPFIVTSQLREQLQQLAEENTLTIGLRIANDPWALEFEPRDRVEAQLRQGPLAATGPSLGLGSANWREEMLEYVYRRARSKGKIVHTRLGEYDFNYALIFTKDGYGKAWKGEKYARPTATYWLRDYVKIGANGTNIPSHAFVFGDSVPSLFRDFVGLHEFIESQGRDHLYTAS